MTVSCDYDTPTLSVFKNVKAAKDHTCCECYGTIHKGEVHEFYKNLYEGSWASFRTCPDCRVVICELTRLLSEDWRCGWLSEGMREQLDNLDSGDQERRIIAMFNATSVARGGFRCTKFDNEGDKS